MLMGATVFSCRWFLLLAVVYLLQKTNGYLKGFCRLAVNIAIKKNWKGGILMVAERTAETQVVVFQLAGETYGLDINYVQEIIRMQNITEIPGTPAFIEAF
jgi:hypothetical protein